MAAELSDDEQIFFRRKADYYDGKMVEKYKVGTGDLLFSNFRVFFQSATGHIIFETVWSNVADDKYSKDTDTHVSIRLELAVTLSSSQSQVVVFKLIGEGNPGNLLLIYI